MRRQQSVAPALVTYQPPAGCKQVAANSALLRPAAAICLPYSASDVVTFEAPAVFEGKEGLHFLTWDELIAKLTTGEENGSSIICSEMVDARDGCCGALRDQSCNSSISAKTTAEEHLISPRKGQELQ